MTGKVLVKLFVLYCIMQYDISPADGQFWHGLQRQTSEEIYLQCLKWDDLCAE